MVNPKKQKILTRYPREYSVDRAKSIAHEVPVVLEWAIIQLAFLIQQEYNPNKPDSLDILKLWESILSHEISNFFYDTYGINIFSKEYSYSKDIIGSALIRETDGRSFRSKLKKDKLYKKINHPGWIIIFSEGGIFKPIARYFGALYYNLIKNFPINTLEDLKKLNEVVSTDFEFDSTFKDGVYKCRGENLVKMAGYFFVLAILYFKNANNPTKIRSFSFTKKVGGGLITVRSLNEIWEQYESLINKSES